MSENMRTLRSEFDRQMKLAEQIMQDDREILRSLGALTEGASEDFRSEHGPLEADIHKQR
ncbi:MAG TPA: hypothetical protein VGM02_11225 [Acidobacteriaceae bacterium]|jgi:hypothetical protein